MHSCCVFDAMFPSGATHKSTIMVDFSLKYRKLWSEWEVRLLVIFSFFLQIFLTISAPARRRNKSKWVNPLIWATYLLADWVAAFALAMLSDVVHDSEGGGAAAAALTGCDNELIAFWAPFLLAHLGGPDTITALALEDNELWLRHLLTLAIHLAAAVYVFLLTLPKNHLLAPTLLIFLVGIGRYVERTRALYLASSRGFPRWMMAKYKERNQLINIDLPMSSEEGIDGVKMVKLAHKFFISYNRLFIDRLLNFFEHRNLSRDFFQSLRANDAFGIMEVELDLACDALYTKAIAIHNRTGYIWRAICFLSILTALAIFLQQHKCRSNPVDEAITYVLLIGAVAVEVIALINIIFSNWMPLSHLRCLEDFSKRVCPYGPPKQPRHISQYNMLGYCLRSKWRWKTMLGIEDLVEELLFISKVRVSEELTNIIFTELREISEEATGMFDAKGNVISCEWDKSIEFESEWLEKLDLDDRILIWHIASGLCYYHELRSDQLLPTAAQKEMIMHISNYLFYLLIMHPSMISTKGGTTGVQCQKICKEALDLMNDENVDGVERFCAVLLSRYQAREDPDAAYRGIGNHLHDACYLADWLLKQPEHWEVLCCKVWMKMLYQAASRSSGRYHSQRLVKGGELLTLVWFLMAHLGLADKYTIDITPTVE